jgi:hypothetical protein
MDTATVVVQRLDAYILLQTRTLEGRHGLELGQHGLLVLDSVEPSRSVEGTESIVVLVCCKAEKGNKPAQSHRIGPPEACFGSTHTLHQDNKWHAAILRVAWRRAIKTISRILWSTGLSRAALTRRGHVALDRARPHTSTGVCAASACRILGNRTECK